MFSSLGLFQKVACPDKLQCNRVKCLFSHDQNLPTQHVELAVATVAHAKPISPNVSSTSVQPPGAAMKRHLMTSSAGASSSTPSPSPEPPRKIQKLSSGAKLPSTPSSQTHDGAPLLVANPATSKVPVPKRQRMVKTLYEHFIVLYNSIAATHPTLAQDHALKQEAEIHAKSTKDTYHNAVISCVAALKRRPLPTSTSHPSVGTQEEYLARQESDKALKNLALTPEMLAPFIMTMDDLVKWGYFVAVLEGPGGDIPSLTGRTAKCERCSQPYMVKGQEEAEQCLYHWGKPLVSKTSGERTRIYSCCSRLVTNAEGCTHGPHVFYETKPEDLHARHPFSFLQPPVPGSSALPVAAMDCEMVCTTGGSRVARVSVVDALGNQVFDELVRMDDGVEVIDYVTRFSGITPEIHSKARLNLAAIRKALDAFIDTETILIGHALDNDLKTLRIIHHKCVDTAILFPHRGGPPYRRALKDLVREKLGVSIQTGGATEGHSSVEDATATLNLVKWLITERRRKKPAAAAASGSRPVEADGFVVV